MHSATPDELRAIDEALAETTPEQIIAAAIEQYAKGDPVALASGDPVGPGCRGADGEADPDPGPSMIGGLRWSPQCRAFLRDV